jgi:hypothetical protein
MITKKNLQEIWLDLFTLDDSNKLYTASELQIVKDPDLRNEPFQRPVFDKDFRGVKAQTLVMGPPRPPHVVEPVPKTREPSSRKVKRPKRLDP